MTSAAGADSHPEVAEISALSEGLLPAGRGTEVRGHVADCELCADVLASLEEIRGLLGSLPGPQRMPEDIAGRIDAALAAEALLDATRPDVPRGTSAHVPRGTPTPVSRPAGGSEASTGPGRTPGGSHPARVRPRRRPGGRTAAISTAVALALAGIFYAVVNVAGSGVTDNSSNGRGTTVSAADGQVEARVHQLLAGTVSGRAGTERHNDSADTPYAAPKVTAPVPPCVLRAAHSTSAPLATAHEPFHGQDAYLLVLPHPHDSTRVDAFVVSASCPANGPGTVLFQDIYPR